jgi:hypothetical protein
MTNPAGRLAMWRGSWGPSPLISDELWHRSDAAPQCEE